MPPQVLLFMLGPPRLPVCGRGPLAAGLAHLCVGGVGALVRVERLRVGVVVPGALGPAVPAVHGAVERVDPRVRVLLLLGAPLRRPDVQDLGVVALPGLTLPQLSGLGLDPDGEDCDTDVDTGGGGRRLLCLADVLSMWL